MRVLGAPSRYANDDEQTYERFTSFPKGTMRLREAERVVEAGTTNRAFQRR
jgi:hypothetical protein